MFTSRVNIRLTCASTTPTGVTPTVEGWGLIDDSAWAQYEQKQAE